MPVRSNWKKKRGPRRFRGRRRFRKKRMSAKTLAKAAFKLAKANRAQVETKIVESANSATSVNFGTTFISESPTAQLASGTGEGEFTGNACQLKSIRIRYRLQNERTGCPDKVRVLVVQFPTETVVGTAPTPPLDTGALPASIHSGVDYVFAPYQRFTEDATTSAATLGYKILYDKVESLASLNEGSGSIAQRDFVLRFKGKSGYLRRDLGTISSHDKGAIWVYFLGTDVNRAAGVSAVDYKYLTQVRFCDP